MSLINVGWGKKCSAALCLPERLLPCYVPSANPINCFDHSHSLSWQIEKLDGWRAKGWFYINHVLVWKGHTVIRFYGQDRLGNTQQNFLTFKSHRNGTVYYNIVMLLIKFSVECHMTRFQFEVDEFTCRALDQNYRYKQNDEFYLYFKT